MTARRVDLRRVGNLTLALTAACVLGSSAVGVGRPASVAAGGAVILVNYHLIRILVSQLMRPRLAKAWTSFLFTLKFVLFFGLVAGAFYRLPIEPVSFAVGASQLLLAILVEALILGDPVEAVREDVSDTRATH
jgi:hypothetical protein